MRLINALLLLCFVARCAVAGEAANKAAPGSGPLVKKAVKEAAKASVVVVENLGN